jgi:hypothetical protein
MRRVLALVPLAVLVAACGGGSSPAGTTTAPTAPATTAAKALKVAISAQSHHPKVGRTWTYQVRVTDAATGKPVAATIHLQFWFGGVSVGEVGTHRVANGVWKETIVAHGPEAFPPAAVGQNLLLHAIVTAKGYKRASAGYQVVVVK